MKLKLDNTHYLNSDGYCYYITTVCVSKNNKESERRTSGYTCTLSQALESYINRRVSSSEAEDLNALSNDIKSLIREVRAWQKPIKKAKAEDEKAKKAKKAEKESKK